MSIDRVFNLTNEDICKIRQIHNIDKESIKRDVEIIREWMRQQLHLPLLDDNYIERFLLRNKFYLEKTKRKIEAYFTIRGQYCDLYECYPTIVPSKEGISVCFLPQLTPNGERVLYFNFKNDASDNYEPKRCFTFSIMILELALKYDYNVGVVYLIDLKGVTLGHVSKLTPTFMSRCNKFFESVYSSRVVHINFVNCPPIMQKIKKLLDMALSPKFLNKIIIHDNFDSLLEKIPRDCLPIEYNGTLGHLSDIIANWDEVFEANKQLFDRVFQYTTNPNENLNENFENNEMFGIDGTFKQINLD